MPLCSRSFAIWTPPTLKLVSNLLFFFQETISEDFLSIRGKKKSRVLFLLCYFFLFLSLASFFLLFGVFFFLLLLILTFVWLAEASKADEAKVKSLTETRSRYRDTVISMARSGLNRAFSFSFAPYFTMLLKVCLCAIVRTCVCVCAFVCMSV